MKKLVLLAAVLAFLPAFAQRGPGNKPLQNYAGECVSGVSAGATCAGYERTWCVKYAEQEGWACSPLTHVWIQFATVSGSTSGGGGTSTIEENSSVVTSTAAIIDFLSGFDIAVTSVNSPNDKVSVSLDYTENPIDLSNAANLTNTLGVIYGGTGASTGPGALTNLGAAARGVNGDINSLTNLTTPLPLSEGGLGITTQSGLDDKIPLGQSSGTAVAWTSVPACLDSGGNHLNYNASTDTFSCGNSSSGGGGSGYATFQNNGSNVTVRTVANFATSGSGTALAAVDNPGSTRTDVTLTTTPTGAASVVGSARTVTAGAGLGGGGALTSDLTLTTASQEAAFLADGGAADLVCGAANQGKEQAMDNGVLQWCDGATTSVLRYSALGDATGRATSGDDAAGFFTSGLLEVTRGGTGAGAIGSDQDILINDGGHVGTDETPGAFKYNKSTNTETVGTLNTFGATDGTREVSLQANVSTPDVPATGAGFVDLYASGSSGVEDLKWRTATGGIFTGATTTGTQTLTNKTLASPSVTTKINWAGQTSFPASPATNDVVVITDDSAIGACDSAAGSAVTVCRWNGAAWAALGDGGSAGGDITQVWLCTTGDCSTLTAGAGDSLDASGADSLRVPYGTAPTVTSNGMVGIDSTHDQLKYESSGAVKVLEPVRWASAVLESLSASDDHYEFFEAPQAVTVTGVSCRCRGTCSTAATFTLENRAGTAMTITGTNPTCSTTGVSTYAAVTANNALVAGQGLAFNVTNTPTTGDTYTITVTYTVDPQ